MRWLALLSLLFVVGCTHFEYDITRPPDLAQHVGTKEDVTAALDPLEYRFRSYEDHLIIRIFNPTEDRIQLLGDQSAVVDPQGQSHPLRNSTIESHSFVKVILPPPPPVVEPYGPTIELGFGMSAQNTADHPIYLDFRGRGGRFHHFHREFIGGWGWNYWDPWYYDDYAPRYYVLYDTNGTDYWTWKPGAEVRLSLAFQRNGKTFRDEFAFRRVKMK